MIWSMIVQYLLTKGVEIQRFFYGFCLVVVYNFLQSIDIKMGLTHQKSSTHFVLLIPRFDFILLV